METNQQSRAQVVGFLKEYKCFNVPNMRFFEEKLEIKQTENILLLFFFNNI